LKVGTAARLYYQQARGLREERPTRIVGHRTAGPKFGRAYQVEWRKVGYGLPVLKWQTADWVGMFPDILEDYNAVLLMCMLFIACSKFECRLSRLPAGPGGGSAVGHIRDKEDQGAKSRGG